MTSKKQASYHHGDLRAVALATATEMIATVGVEKLTMRGLGKQVGVSQTALYRHFADKNTLLAAVAEVGFRRLHEQLDAANVWEESAALRSFQQMGVAYIEFAVANPTHYQLMFGNIPFHHETYPDCAAVGREVFNVLVRAIERGQQSGELKDGDALAWASVAWSTVHGAASLLIAQQLGPVDDVHAFATLTTQTLVTGMAQHKAN